VAASSVHVSVPASSANLGPGFDCFALALALALELEVSESERFSVTSDLDLPLDRTNLVVSAFERLHPAEGLGFSISSEIPLSGGLGSSAAATLAGLLAASRLGGMDVDVLALASELEGHPDNVAASLHGGVVVVADGLVHRFDAPTTLATLLVVPDEGVTTSAARAALPASVPLEDAVFNTAHGALLMLGLQGGDHELIADGLHDRVHEPYRAALYPRSAELVAGAAQLGALGATISGAGPSILFWAAREDAARLKATLEAEADGWARVIATEPTNAGALVEERT
jgi:homoserine kinase